MFDEIKKEAEKTVEQKKAFYILAVIFACISVLLGVISFMIGPPASFWIRLPILVFILVLIIVYSSLFGIPFLRFLDAGWKEEQVEKEMARLMRNKDFIIPDSEELSEEDYLELKELERLKRKWEDDEDYV